MSILVYCDHESGQVALPAALIEGRQKDVRTYEVVQHLVDVHGEGDEVIAAHDAAHICKLSNYRLATPTEQREYVKAKRKTGDLTESKKTIEA